MDGDPAVLVGGELFRIGDRLFLRVEQFDRPFAFGELDLPLAVLAARHVVIFHRGFCLALPVGGLFFIFFRLFLGFGLLRFGGTAFRFFGKFAPVFGRGVPALPVCGRGGFTLCLRNGFVFYGGLLGSLLLRGNGFPLLFRLFRGLFRLFGRKFFRFLFRFCLFFGFIACSFTSRRLRKEDIFRRVFSLPRGHDRTPPRAFR